MKIYSTEKYDECFPFTATEGPAITFDLTNERPAGTP